MDTSSNIFPHVENNISGIDRLNQLIGLEPIKKEIEAMISLVNMQEVRRKKGLKAIPVSKHMVFTGNPGTGKTTVARLIAEVYKEIGVLSKGHLVEVDRSSLVAGYVGQTAIKTQEQINKALGGILFIDEAYTLNRKGDNDFGQEAIDTILKSMEDHREDLIVIVAGYTELMEDFINSNPGLRSRFNKYIHFADYSADELMKIFSSFCTEYDYIMTDEVHEFIYGKIKDLVKNKTKNFANARDIRNMVEDIITRQALRTSNKLIVDENALSIIQLEDCY